MAARRSAPEITAPFPDWSGQAIAIIASGPSAAVVVPHIPASMPVLAVNRSHELYPGAAALYAADSGFWMHYASARAFAGRKFAPDARARDYCPAVELVSIDPNTRGMAREPLGVIGHGRHSGYQAVNLAAQWGAATIHLIGYDYFPGHWHADHPRGLRNPTPRGLADWARGLDAAAAQLASWGIDVINLSPNSMLTKFRKESPECLSRHA